MEDDALTWPFSNPSEAITLLDVSVFGTGKHLWPKLIYAQQSWIGEEKDPLSAVKPTGIVCNQRPLCLFIVLVVPCEGATVRVPVADSISLGNVRRELIKGPKDDEGRLNKATGLRRSLWTWQLQLFNCTGEFSHNVCSSQTTCSREEEHAKAS